MSLERETWGNIRHRSHRAGHSRAQLRNWLVREVTPIVKPLDYKDISNWRGKSVWCNRGGKQVLVLVVTALSPDRWFVQQQVTWGWSSMQPVAVSSLELYPPCEVKALALYQEQKTPVARAFAVSL